MNLQRGTSQAASPSTSVAACLPLPGCFHQPPHHVPQSQSQLGLVPPNCHDAGSSPVSAELTNTTGPELNDVLLGKSETRKKQRQGRTVNLRNMDLAKQSHANRVWYRLGHPGKEAETPAGFLPGLPQIPTPLSLSRSSRRQIILPAMLLRPWHESKTQWAELMMYHLFD